MNQDLTQHIKRLTLKAMVSDDYLLENLTLKGGNALDLIYRLNQRGSYDLDFSLEEDFSEELATVEARIHRTLDETFREEGFAVIDFRFRQKPRTIEADLKDFWGGYQIEFKIVDWSFYEIHRGAPSFLSGRAIALHPQTQSSKVEVEISKFEFVGKKERHQIDGLYVYVYAPILILFEKVRALCQQTQEYGQLLHRDTVRGRARDFFDIHSILENSPGIDIYSQESQQLLLQVFAAKKVPLDFISLIARYKNLHEENFQALKNTVTSPRLESFDFYFAYVVDHFERLLAVIKSLPGSTAATP